MDINIYYLELEKWFKRYSLDGIAFTLNNNDPDYVIRLHVFKNALKTYTLLVTSYEMSRVVYDNKEFQEVCESQNIGVIKDILVMFEKYIRSKGYRGNVEIAQILDD